MRSRHLAWLLIGSLGLAGCGGGGPQTIGAGTGGSGDIPAGAGLGPVSATQPLTIADIAFDTTNITVRVEDGDDDGRGPLPGMVARAEGGLFAGNRSGRATSASTQAELRGPITSVDAAAGRFTAMGQTVRVDGQTRFDNVSGLAALGVGDSIQVHGLAGPGDTLLATRLQRRSSASTVFKVVGSVRYEGCATCLPSGQEFLLGGLTVQAQAAALKGLSLPVPPGTLVRVRAGAAAVQGRLVATAIEPYVATPLLADAITRSHGLVMDPKPTGFQLGGLNVAFDAQTRFEGWTVADPRAELAAGARVDVEGRYRSGTVTAASVTLR